MRRWGYPERAYDGTPPVRSMTISRKGVRSNSSENSKGRSCSVGLGIWLTDDASTIPRARPATTSFGSIPTDRQKESSAKGEITGISPALRAEHIATRSEGKAWVSGGLKSGSVSPGLGPRRTTAPTIGRALEPCFSRLVMTHITSSTIAGRSSCSPRGRSSCSTTMTLTRPSFYK